MTNAFVLPRPTNRTVKGPIYKGGEGSVVLEYDYEGDDGSFAWVKITFSEVLLFCFKEAVACSTEDILSSTDLHNLSDSWLLRETVQRWSKSVGWQSWQAEQGGVERYKHFKVYFDDAGGVDIIAASFAISAPTSLP